MRDIKIREDHLADESVQEGPSLNSQLEGLPKYQCRLLRNVSLCASVEEVWKASREKKKLTIVTDRGLKDNRGTFGWTLSTADNLKLYEGSGPVDGPRDFANSTRCEIAGLVAPVLLLTLLASHWGTRFKCKFRWVCDSKSAISNVQKHTSGPQYSRIQPSNVDLLSQIFTLKAELGKLVEPKWIKGHQSTKLVPSKDVARNNRADELATSYREQHRTSQSQERIDHVPEARVSIRIKGIIQIGQVESCLRFHINGYHMRCYLQHRHEWPDDVWDTIDLTVLGQFCRSLTPSNHTAQAKCMNYQRHTGLQRYRVAKVKDPTLRICPCCLNVDEDDDHVLLCEGNPGRENAIRVLRRTLDSATNQSPITVFGKMLMGWLAGRDHTVELQEYPIKHHDWMVAAVTQQQRIGWSAAIRGFLSVE